MTTKASTKSKASSRKSKPAPVKGAETKAEPAAPVVANGIIELLNADTVDIGEILANALKWEKVKHQLQQEHELIQAHDAFGDLVTSDGEKFTLSIDCEYLKANYDIVLKGIIKPFHKATDKRVKALKAKRAGK